MKYNFFYIKKIADLAFEAIKNLFKSDKTLDMSLDVNKTN